MFARPNRMSASPAIPVVHIRPKGSKVPLWLAALMALWSGVAHAAEFSGKVVAVADGDTLTVLVDRRQVKVRLTDIDAPEKKQPFGARSKQSLADMCAGKAANVDDHGKDRYGRTLGHVTCAGVDANAEQVRHGMAWVYERYAPKGSPLYGLQAQAQREHRGLWADPRPIAPWEWRRRVNGKQEPRQ